MAAMLTSAVRLEWSYAMLGLVLLGVVSMQLLNWEGFTGGESVLR